MSLHALARLALPFVVIMYLAGCSSVVKKPEVNQVKRAAIVSLYANQKVPHEKGYGVVRDWDDKIRLQVAEDALRTYSEELQKIGWQIVPPDEVVQSKEYQDTFSLPAEAPQGKMGKFMNTMADLSKNSYRAHFFAPAGMLPIQLNDEQANTKYYGDAKRRDPKQALAQMAKKLGVDAVVIVQIDYCYGGGALSLLGTGQAVMSAGSAIKAVNQDGTMVINMPVIPTCGGKRAESATKALMVEGSLLFTRIAKDTFRNMFIEATRESAKLTLGELQKALK